MMGHIHFFNYIKNIHDMKLINVASLYWVVRCLWLDLIQDQQVGSSPVVGDDRANAC